MGARKGRNVRDNIFVVNSVLNAASKNKEVPVDIQVFDMEKCFDALWLHDCINDLYDAGVNNDKLPLLFQENAKARVAVKNGDKLSKRIDIHNVVMQHSVWGSLMCTTSMSKLVDLAYEKPDLCLKYKDIVVIPPLGMIDDILCLQRCSKLEAINDSISTFIELKKLKFSHKKCSQIHVGKGIPKCEDLKGSFKEHVQI